MNCIIHTMFLVIRTTYAIYSSMTVTYAISIYSFVERSDPEMPLHYISINPTVLFMSKQVRQHRKQKVTVQIVSRSR